MTETRTREGRVTSKSHHVEEHVPPELRRFVDTISSGGVSTTEEIIQIGRSGFQKRERAPWVEWTGSVSRFLAPGTYTICNEDSDEVCSYSSSESVLDRQAAQVLSRTGVRNINGLRIRGIEKVWISRDGTLLRTEIVIAEGALSKEWVKKIVSTWEYDPAGIKIEAPIQ